MSAPTEASLRLTYAIWGGQLNKIAELIDSGINPNDFDTWYCPPMHHLSCAINKRSTTMKERLQMLDLLLEKGADINARDNNGLTFLHRLVRCSDRMDELIVKAIKAGANIEAKDNEGHTPLYHAYINPNICTNHKFLLAAGADPNARNNKGETILVSLLQLKDFSDDEPEWDPDCGNLYELSKECVEGSAVSLLYDGADISRIYTEAYPKILYDAVPEDVLREIQTYVEDDPLDVAISNGYEEVASIIAESREIDLAKYRLRIK